MHSTEPPIVHSKNNAHSVFLKILNAGVVIAIIFRLQLQPSKWPPNKVHHVSPHDH